VLQAALLKSEFVVPKGSMVGAVALAVVMLELHITFCSLEEE
jgi:hypothetical protein